MPATPPNSGPDDEVDAADRRTRRRDAQRDQLVRRRRLTAAGVIAGLALVFAVAVAKSGDGGEGAEQASAQERRSQLPGGGRSVFPEHRVVAFYGAPQDDELGVLGIGDPRKVADKLDAQAKPYGTRQRPVLPAMELIATIAANAPGSDGMYRTRQHSTIIRQYLMAARHANAILLLDIQPGRADFLSETKALKRWLKEPDVGLALDPEWRMAEGEIPGQTIGSVRAEEVNAVSAWLSGLVRENDLPEKVLAVHRFTEEMVEQQEALESHPGIALTLNVDGFGTREAKLSKYRDLVPKRFNAGFKLFYKEDEGLMEPDAVLKIRPQPDLVIYE